jgi:hypothetical protein
MKKIVAIDDLAYYRSQAEIEAPHEFTFSWEGTTYVLDLGEGNHADVTKYFTELANAATILRNRPGAKNPGGSGPGTSNGGRSRKENGELRVWVRANNIMAREGKPRLAFLTPEGKHRYPEWLWSAYDMREAVNGLGGDRPEQRAADAGNRGSKV